MKRICMCIAGLFAFAGLAFAATETIYLKNGSVIKGEIIEQIPGESLKVKTKDGSIFVYQVAEVERIAKEEEKTTEESGHKGLDFSLATGVTVMSGSTAVPFELTLSKRFHKNLSVGLGAGVDVYTGGGKPTIPIFADVRGYFPLNSTKLVPFLDIKAGYAINTADDITVGSSKNPVTVKMPNFAIASFMPGVRLPLSYTTDLDLSLGYMMYAATSGGGTTSAFGLRLGLNFHKSTNPNPVAKIKEKKPVVPTRNTGFEFGIEGFAGQIGGANILLGYRLSKKLTVDLGIGGFAGLVDADIPGCTYTYFSEADGGGNAIYEKSDPTWQDNYGGYKLFLRGEYRFLNRKFSPIVALDLGFKKILTDLAGCPPLIDQKYLYDQMHVSTSTFFIRPAVGISWRCTNNSYLQLSVGCDFGTKIKADNIGVTNTHDRINGVGTYESIVLKRPGKSLYDITFALTWKRTFGLFSRD